jgi:acetylornithine deacetylase/succinyl-diaminopimelate desuccinylase-like protein
MTEKAIAYIDANKDRFIAELKAFLSFPSISSQSAHDKDVAACAAWLRDHLASLGLDARVVETQGRPIVEAIGRGRSGRKLILYGHYDVQPADSGEPWQSPPFAPEVRDGIIFARGATDDKGQLFAHIKAVESILRTSGQLPCDVRFLFEGEEESGGDSLKKYVEAQKKNLDPDAVVISDTCLYDENTPALTCALRGLVGLEITVRTAARDLHSGAYGGAIGNPAIALSHIIDACVGPDGAVRVPGFYDQIRPLEDWERRTIQSLKFDERALLEESGAKKVFGEPGFSALERIWARPTFDVNGLTGGYVDKGMKTIIPASATAKISMRLVPDQDPVRVFRLVADYVKARCPAYAQVDVQGPFGAAPPILFDVTNPIIGIAREALRRGFGAEPVFVRCGGSIPVAATFWEELKKPVVLMGFGLDSDGAHSSNEHFKLAGFINGAKTSVYFLDAFADSKPS